MIMTNIHTKIDEVFAEYEKVEQRFVKPFVDSHTVTNNDSLEAMHNTMQEIVKLMKSLDVDY